MSKRLEALVFGGGLLGGEPSFVDRLRQPVVVIAGDGRRDRRATHPRAVRRPRARLAPRAPPEAIACANRAGL